LVLKPFVFCGGFCGFCGGFSDSSVAVPCGKVGIDLVDPSTDFI
jgi:hypothetical protein